MKNVNSTPYISPKLDVIALECNDIMTVSSITPGTGSGGGYVGDDNILENW